jgi:hypothetical protein
MSLTVFLSLYQKMIYLLGPESGMNPVLYLVLPSFWLEVVLSINAQFFARLERVAVAKTLFQLKSFSHSI